jgi:hypothetical protein
LAPHHGFLRFPTFPSPLLQLSRFRSADENIGDDEIASPGAAAILGSAMTVNQMEAAAAAAAAALPYAPTFEIPAIQPGR